MITFTDTYYARVLKTLRDVIHNEFSENKAYVYINDEFKEFKGASIRLFLNDSTLVERLNNGDVYEVSVEISYYLNYPESNTSNDKEDVIEKLLVGTDRLQQLLFTNRNFTSGSKRLFFNGTIDNIVVNSKTSDETNIDNLQVSRLNFTCQVAMNLT